MDKTIVITVLLIILAGFLFWGFQTGFFAKIFAGPTTPTPPVAPTGLPSGTILFYGQECPHCKIVEAYITANNIDQKVKFTQLEVPFAGKTSPQLVANAELAIQLAQGCKLDVSKGVSIPFLYDGKNCLIGQDDVINFFKNAAGIK
jgi:glutaredoxin